jgi:uncharacterized protein
VTRVVLDTNLLLSALINPQGLPAQVLQLWRDGHFDLLTSAEQLLELGDVARRSHVRVRIIPSNVGRLINDLRRLAWVVSELPAVDRSPDPADNFLLAIAQGGKADYLVSGDRRGVLSLKQHGATQIVDARAFCKLYS